MVDFEKKFEIANISSNEDVFYKYPIFRTNYFIEGNRIFSRKIEEEVDINEILPLSSYYYEALALTEINDEIKQTLYNCEKELLKCWLLANDNNFLRLKDLVKKTSIYIKMIYNENYHSDYSNKRINNYEIVSEINNCLVNMEEILNEE